MASRINIMWFRRDLRLTDNAALYHALKAGIPVLPVFIFDRLILDKLENKQDRRVEFIHDTIEEMQAALGKAGSRLEVIYGFPAEVFERLLLEYDVQTVFSNHDYEAYAIERDMDIRNLLAKKAVGFQTFKDQVIFEKDEVVKDDGKPYTVFTPYSRKWKALLNDFYLASYPVNKYVSNFLRTKPFTGPTLAEMGFQKTKGLFSSKEILAELLQEYKETRDFPGKDATTRLGIHLRFGTISIRELARKALESSEIYLNELIWRDFYQMILANFPQVGKGKSFRPEYDQIQWRNNETEFAAWCEGRTGYPIVDAGMRQLNATGFMHNRVRMITASFLIKHLLIDWRWGEAYFAEKLLDYDLASNNGGWQWAAGSGCDAAPYFRIFNPTLQTKRFDAEFKYIRQWVPEFDSFNYPQPIVVHEVARKRVLEVFAAALKK